MVCLWCKMNKILPFIFLPLISSWKFRENRDSSGQILKDWKMLFRMSLTNPSSSNPRLNFRRCVRQSGGDCSRFRTRWPRTQTSETIKDIFHTYDDFILRRLLSPPSHGNSKRFQSCCQNFRRSRPTIEDLIFNRSLSHALSANELSTDRALGAVLVNRYFVRFPLITHRKEVIPGLLYFLVLLPDKRKGGRSFGLVVFRRCFRPGQISFTSRLATISHGAKYKLDFGSEVSGCDFLFIFQIYEK